MASKHLDHPAPEEWAFAWIDALLARGARRTQATRALEARLTDPFVSELERDRLEAIDVVDRLIARADHGASD